MISFHTSEHNNKQGAAPYRVRQGRGCEDKSRVKGSMVGNQTGMRGTLQGSLRTHGTTRGSEILTVHS